MERRCCGPLDSHKIQVRFIVSMLSRVSHLTKNTVVRNSIVVFAGMMIANVSSYLYHLVVGRILGPEGYGELAALLSLLYIFNVPADVVRFTLVKFFSQLKATNDVGQAKTLLLRSSQYLFILVCAGGVIMIPFISYLAEFLHIQNHTYFALLYVIFGSFFLTTIAIAALQGFQRFNEATMLNNAGMILRLVLSAAGALVGVGMALIGNVVSNVLGYILYFFPMRFMIRAKALPLTISKRSAAGVGIPVTLATLGITLLYSQDVILVKHFFPGFEAGIYSALSIIGKVIFFATSAIGIVALPTVAERSELGKRNDTIIWGALAAVAAVSFSITAGYFILPGLAVHLFFGTAFDGAIPLVGVFGIFLSLFSLSHLLMTVCIGMGKTRVWVLTMAAACAQIVLMNVFHSTLLGVIIVNIAVTGGLFMSLLVYYIYARS